MTGEQLARYLRDLADRVESRGIKAETVKLEWHMPTVGNQESRKHTGEYILRVRWFWK